MVFSRKRFEENAEPYVKKLVPENHRTALDGLPVQFVGESFGTVDYEVQGEEFTLYPVYPEWCEEELSNGI